MIDSKIEMTEGIFDFVHISSKIQSFIRRNDRTGALEYLSKTIGFQKYSQIFSHINAIKQIEDKVPQTIIDYEEEVFDEMSEKALKVFGNDYLIIFDAL